MDLMKILGTAFVVVFFFGMMLFCWSACVMASWEDEQRRREELKELEDEDYD